MVTSVSKSTIFENIWKNFYDRVKDQVTSVTLTNSTTVSIGTNSYCATFPDQLIDSKSDYPILVVDSPDIITSPSTMNKTISSGTITLSIYATNAEAVEKFLSSIVNAIETYKHTFATVGIKNIELESTGSSYYSRDKINVHMRECVFSFNYYYTKTTGF